MADTGFVGTVKATQSMSGSVLDIPKIDNTLTKDRYAADAKATGELIANTKSAVEEAMAEMDTRLSNEIAVESARITNLASLEEGSTTADAELIDLRVAHDGETFASAGDAVRQQFKDITSKISVNEKNLLDVSCLRDGYIDPADGKAKSGTLYGFDKYTGLIPVKPSTDYYRSYSNFFAYKADGTYIGRLANDPWTAKVTTTDETAFARLSLRTSDDLTVAYLSSVWNMYVPYQYELEGLHVPDENPWQGKITPIGILSIRDGSEHIIPCIDLVHKQIIIYNGTRVLCGKTRYTVDADVTLTLLDETASIKHIVFNTATKAFRIVYTTEENLMADTDYIVMSVCFADVWHTGIKSVFSTCDYIVYPEGAKNDGNIPTKVSDLVNDAGYITEEALEDYERKTDANNLVAENTFFYPCNIKDWYTPYGEDEDYSLFSIRHATTPYASYISAFDALVADYPEYITKTHVGNDATGTYPIYKYDFNPVRPGMDTNGASTAWFNPKNFPKIIITGGLHGDEKNSPFGIYYLVRDMLTHWQDSELLEYLRFNVNLVIIPVVNPYGFNHPNTQEGSRYNGRHVNINRNFDYEWSKSPSDPNDQNYRGETPGSESETQIVMQLVQDNQDAIYYVDYHTNGSTYTGTNPLHTVWHIYPVSKMLYNLQGASEYHLAKMSRRAKADYGLPMENEHYGYWSWGNTASVFNWSCENGVPCTTLECPTKFINETSHNSPAVNRFSAEVLGNWLGAVLMLCSNQK